LETEQTAFSTPGKSITFECKTQFTTFCEDANININTQKTTV